jgi:RNA polymerase sigma factor (sigma-70 family)
VEDERMIVRADPLTFEVVYRQERPGLVRLSHLLTGSNAVAEEVVQEAFLELHRRWGGIANPKAYVTRAVVNRSRSVLRRRAVERRYAPADARVTLPPEIDETWTALARLPAKRRVALVLRYYEDRPIVEIAELMQVRPGTVKSLIHRGLASLKEQLKEHLS